MKIPVTLRQEQIDFADRLSQRRVDYNVEHRPPRVNNQPYELCDGRETIIGTRAEFAGAIGLQTRDWNTKVGAEFYNEPDIAGFVDAKSIKKRHHQLVLQIDPKRTHPDWAYLVVYSGDHPTYELLKWCWGKDAMQDRFRSDPVGGREAYFVPLDEPFMQEPETLMELIAQLEAMA